MTIDTARLAAAIAEDVQRMALAARVLDIVREEGCDVAADSTGALYCSGPTPPVCATCQALVELFAEEMARLLNAA